jgi:hypothetical protein
MTDLTAEQARLDPYSSAAENTNHTLQEKITGTCFVMREKKKSGWSY